MTRYYANGQHGSTSTLPSSTDASSDDNLFAGVPRTQVPQVPQHNSTSRTYSLSNFRKQLPSLPKQSSPVAAAPPQHEPLPTEPNSRNRALTASSYASTAIPPKLDADLNFGDSSFDDMFSGLSRNEPPSPKESAGRSLLSEKRTFQAEPIKVHPKLEVEPPLTSWDSRGSAEKLISSPRSDNDSPPPPPPPHKFSSYAPLASESPTQMSLPAFPEANGSNTRKSFMTTTSYRESSPELKSVSISSSSANSYDTPLSSRPASNRTNNTTPKASLAPTLSAQPTANDAELFMPTQPIVIKSQATPSRQSAAPAVPEHRAAPASATGGPGKRVMTQAEFREQQKRQMAKPAEDSSDDDYEDEEEAIKKREDEEIMRRKNQQMHFAREAMRRSTTAPANPNRPESIADGFTNGMGFPSETSLGAADWEDEDVPLGILAQHGFPSQTRNRMPSQPHNAIPSHFPDRPASTGGMSNRASQAQLPAFARNLPVDPYIGGGLVRPTNRESMGFNNGFARGPASIAGDSFAGGMGASSPLMYHDAGMSQPSLVDQIQMRDMSKQKYMGGASNKKPQGGPFTGMLGQHMNASGQPQNPMRMSQMPAMNGMNGMNGMNPMMMGGQMPMMGMGMGMGMGMNPQMGFPMSQQDQMIQMQQFQQMQQMLAMQQMQLQQMQAMQQPQDPRMSMAMPNNTNSMYGNPMGNGSLLSVPGIPNGSQNMANRPMSFMSVGGNQMAPPQRPMSNFMGPGSTYTPSIAPSERSNIGHASRYRPVANHSDSMSNGTSMTLQASNGANQSKPGTIKGILKKANPQANGNGNGNAKDDDEDWSKMAARKSRMIKGKENNESELEKLTRGFNI